ALVLLELHPERRIPTRFTERVDGATLRARDRPAHDGVVRGLDRDDARVAARGACVTRGPQDGGRSTRAQGRAEEVRLKVPSERSALVRSRVILEDIAELGCRKVSGPRVGPLPDDATISGPADKRVPDDLTIVARDPDAGLPPTIQGTGIVHRYVIEQGARIGQGPDLEAAPKTGGRPQTVAHEPHRCL